MVGCAQLPLEASVSFVEKILGGCAADKLCYRFPRFRRLAEGSPTCLIRDGRVLHEKLDFAKGWRLAPALPVPFGSVLCIRDMEANLRRMPY